MNWEALGAIAELVGAIGVVATLVYLAVQLRSNTRSLNAAGYQAVTDNFGTLNRDLANSEDLAEIFLKAREDHGSLTKIEWVRLHGYFYGAFSAFESLFHGYARGTIDEELWDSAQDGIRDWFELTAFTEWWETANPRFTKRFIEAVNELRGAV